MRHSFLRTAAALAWLLPAAATFHARGGSGDIYLQCLTNFESYAETIWQSAGYSNAPADAGYWGDGGSSGNGGIRGNSGVALAYATLVVAQPGHPRNSTRLDRIRQALNYDTATHVTGTNVCVDGKNWGWSSASSGDWQTPLWAGSMGLACLLVQSNLPPAVVSNVQRVVASEADHRAGLAPASGYIGDTKAEENAWQGNILALAAAWLSAHPGASNWLWAAKRYCANTYTVANTTGDPLAPWLSTVTLYPSFALENHGFYHPTYEMVAGMSLGDSLLMARLANPAIAADLQPFAEHNVTAVWTNNLNALVMDSGDFAYPAGLDWELHDFEQNSFIAWMAAHFNDPLARWTDDKLEQCVRYRQIVNGDGRFVGPSGGGFYREAVEARRTAIAWLHWANADFPTGPSQAPPPVVVHYPDVRVIHQRSAFASFSVSYKSGRIMAVIEPAAQAPPTNAFLATPRLPGVLGLGALGNPTAAELVTFNPNGEGFDAELQLTHGALGTTAVFLKSTGETFAVVEVPRPAPGAISSNAASFSCGIENDPLTGGARLVEWTGGGAVVTNRSGVTRNVTNDWICVAGRYGLAAGPGGYFRYRAAAGYNRPGAAEDTLEYWPTNSFAPRYAVWFPARDAAQTAVAAASLSWTVATTNATLTFPGAGGAPAQMVVPLADSPGATYLPYPVTAAAVSASSWQTAYPPTNAADGNLATFWVSLYGPTNHAEWLRVDFPRVVAVSHFQVVPRSDNGGYGPSAIQLVLNLTNTIPASGIPTSGANVFQATMSATTPLFAKLDQPVCATNAVLVITGAYDRGSTNAPRNTQVVELTCFERALPDTFGDWAVRHFSDAQLADPSVSGVMADPDGDGAPNLLEFAMGGEPLTADAANFQLHAVAAGEGGCRFRFRERKHLVDVQRRFETSTNLLDWTEAVPWQESVVADLPDVTVREATFAMPDGVRFFRLRFTRVAP